MIVFVAGMPRSGSTFTFNVVRGLLQSRGRLHQAAIEGVVEAMEHAGSAEHLIFKGHAADELTVKLLKLRAIKVVCSLRKPEDAVASLMEAFGASIEDAIAAVDRWLHMYQEIKDHALSIRFETIEENPFGAARSIARYVCSDSTAEEADAICREFTKDRVLELSRKVEAREGAIEDVGFSYYDKDTLFHRRHVTSLEERKADTRIGSEEIALVRKSFRSYCDEEGNLR